MAKSHTIVAAFSEDQIQRLTGITKKQLRYWDRTNFYKPSFAEHNRRLAYSRVYSFCDVVALRVLHVLRNQHGVSLQHLREVSEKLNYLESEKWTGVRLYVLNKKVIWVDPGTKLPQEVVTNQYLLPSVEIDRVVADTEADIVTKKKRDPANVGKLQRSRYVAHNSMVISGTRIPVSIIKQFGEAGYSPQQIQDEYPQLELDDIKAALEYEETRSAA